MSLEYQEYLKANVVIDDNGCWLWQGSIGSSKGYGRAKRLNGCQWAHRNSFAVFKRPLTMLELALHTCDNPPCINPEHLYAGNYHDNNSRSLELGRRLMPTTLAEPKSGYDGIKSIREQADGKTVEQLADEFGISTRQVGRIINKEAWRRI